MTVAARSEVELRAVATATGAAHVVVDLAEECAAVDLARQAVELNGPIDVLVNNAGADAVGPFTALKETALVALYRVNLVAPAMLCHHVLPAMAERGHGHIVNISSVTGAAALPGTAAYSSSKAGLTHLSAALRRELRGSGVGVTSVELGPVDTSMFERAQSATGPTSASFRRLFRLGMLTTADADTVACRIVKAVRRDRAHVRLPRRTSAMLAIAAVPQSLLDVALIGVSKS